MKMQDIQPIGKKHPFIIAGPCSAETEEQVMETARQLAAQNIDLFRAGIWKPRTRPNSFEGVGKEGLKWLKNVKAETGLKVTTEVANTKHVFEALKHGVDVVWLGARTTVNPFSVQEVADALEGVDIPVLIKNPINPDLKLWIGAIERIYKAGIRNIGVIHRGFSAHGASNFRNIPRWQIPLELKRQFPDIMIVCDNSHICGKRETLHEVAQKALDLNFDGIMTETHITPDDAWSDAAQQITPTQFKEMTSNLVWRREGNGKVAHDLTKYREEIDEIDHELLDLLGRRMGVAKKIGFYKKENNISIYQRKRWDEILEKAVAEGAKRGLGKQFIEQYLRTIHQESINHQEEIMKMANVTK